MTHSKTRHQTSWSRRHEDFIMSRTNQIYFYGVSNTNWNIWLLTSSNPIACKITFCIWFPWKRHYEKINAIVTISGYRFSGCDTVQVWKGFPKFGGGYITLPLPANICSECEMSYILSSGTFASGCRIENLKLSL